jgi:hypothetical protein
MWLHSSHYITNCHLPVFSFLQWEKTYFSLPVCGCNHTTIIQSTSFIRLDNNGHFIPGYSCKSDELLFILDNL